jgi:hypothetical protein
MVHLSAMNKTVALIGRGKTKQFAPWNNPLVDIWAYNDNAMNLPRVDAAFEMHTDALVTDRYTPAIGYVDWLRQPHKFPIWMHDSNPEIPSSCQFPRCAINALYSRNLWKGEREVQDFYTSSTPYAFALAIYRRYERIEIYGIDLAGATGEYAKHSDCIFYWIGKATALGIDVVVHETSPLLEGLKLYGVIK